MRSLVERRCAALWSKRAFAPARSMRQRGLARATPGCVGTQVIGASSSFFAAFEGTNNIREKLAARKVCSLLFNRHGVLGRWLYGALLLFIAVALSACAAGPKLLNHAFGFDARIDSPRFEVLAYRYADGDVVARSSDSAIRRSQQPVGGHQRSNAFG